MLALQAIHRLVNDRRGFTLIETLVAILTGVVVTGALFAILEVSLHQEARISDVAQANQLGRTAMTKVIDGLHSTCLAPGFAPIREKSTESELRFVNAYSNKATIPTASESSTEGAYERRIKWEESKAGSKTGVLVEYSYPSTSYSTEKGFTFSTTASPSKGVRLGENISQSENSEKKAVPIFRYYKYATESNSSSSSGLNTLEQIKLSSTESLAETTAKEAASVLVSFNTAPTDGTTTQGRSADFSNQVTFAFSAPNSETPIEDSPCE